MKRVFLHRLGLFAIRAGVVLAAVCAALLLTNWVGVEIFGQFSIIWALMVMGAPLVSMGGAKLLLREIPARNAQDVTAISFYPFVLMIIIKPAILAFLYGFLLWCFAAVFGAFPALKMISLWPIYVGVSAFVLHILNVVVVFVRVGMGTGWTMFIRDGLHHSCAILAGGLIVAYGEASAIGVFELMLAILGFALLIILINLFRVGAIVFSSTAHPLSQELRAFWGNAVMGSLAANIDVLIAGMILNAELVALYVVLKRVANFVSFSQVIANDMTSVPISESFARGEIDKIRSACIGAIKMTVPFSLLASAVVLIGMPVWLPLFDLSDTHGGFLTLLLLVVSNFVSVSFGMNFMVAAQTGLEKYALLARILGIIALVCCVFLLHPLFSGAEKIGAAQFVCVTMMNVVIWAVVIRSINVDTSLFGLIRKKT